MEMAAPSPEMRSIAPRRPGRGLLVAGLLLLAVEAWLHTDAFLYRYRSVFAAGRAMGKILYVEAKRPRLLILGNSRADNGFDPATVSLGLHFLSNHGAFNLGLPGADARVLAGVIDRLDHHGLLGVGGVTYVVLSLDESIVQSVDTLGQDVFFASPTQMWRDGQYEDAFGATFRLYGYGAHFKQLREPAMLERFVRASSGNVDPVGGSAASHSGYRAGFGGLQRADAALLQDEDAVLPPDPVNLRNLRRLLDTLSARGVQVAVVFPPLLHRNVMYLGSGPDAKPYRDLAAELRHRGISLLALDDKLPRDPAEFVNPGHLNDLGAQRYSALLGRALTSLWDRRPARAPGNATS